MVFGWWIKTPKSAEGTYTFEPRLGGRGLADTFPSQPGGTARYTGLATGRYVKEDRSETVESDGDFLTAATSGIFTADATLIAVGTSVSGNVRNFKEGGRSLGDWAVLLNSDNITTLQVGDTPETGAGMWNAWYVPSHVGGADAQSFGNVEHPVSAAGYFGAKIEQVLHVSGAFGAKRQGP